MNPNPHDTPGAIQTPHLECFRSAMVTGHRPQHFTPEEAAWAQVALHKTAWRLRSIYGTTEAVSGFALGADSWFALAALSAGLRLAAYIPFEDQPVKWSAVDQALWAELRRRAHREVLVGAQHYDVKMLHARNDAMLKDADLVVAVYKPGTPGGTASAVAKATKKNQPILMLNPVARTISRQGW